MTTEFVLISGNVTTFDGTAAMPGASVGEVPTVQADGTLAAAPAVVAGAVILRGPFAVTFATAGLNAGVDVYTPTPGDLLIGIGVVVTVGFNGTTPLLDLACGQTSGGTGIFANQEEGLAQDVSAPSATVGSAPITSNYSLYYAVFATDDPLQVWVSEDGTLDGTATGSTAGALELYIVTATPVAL